MRIFKDVIGYDKLYSIDNSGNVYSKRTNKILSQGTDTNGYKFVILCNNGKRKCKRIHRLVAEAFLPNDFYTEVNHIDENKANNSVENLEWCDRKYNCNYRNKNKNIMKKVICVDENKEFNSIKECAKYYGVTSTMICKVLNGTFKTTHGLSFKYKEVI